MKIAITNFPTPDELQVENVENKWPGHPDSLADAIASEVANDYSRYCLSNFWTIPSFNWDKNYVGWGGWKRGYGFREMVEPIKYIQFGRFSSSFNWKEIPIRDLVCSTAQRVLLATLPELVGEVNAITTEYRWTTNSVSEFKFKPRWLEDVPFHDVNKRFSSDTAIVVASAPFTPTEKLVLDIQKHFYQWVRIPRYEYFGQDIKVMARRNGKQIDVTICVPWVTTKFQNYQEFRDAQIALKTQLDEITNRSLADSWLKTNIKINTQEQIGSLRSHPYLTAIGSCIDNGEEGSVWRWNSLPSNLISSCRVDTKEAPAWKNIVYHSSPVLTYYANEIAQLLANRFSIRCQLSINAENGDPLLSPASINVLTPDSTKVSSGDIQSIVEEVFSRWNHVDALIAWYLIPKAW